MIFFFYYAAEMSFHTQAHSRLELNVMASYNLGSERKTSKVSLPKPSQHSGLKKMYGFPAASSVKSGNLNPHHTYQTYIQTEKQYIKHWMQKNWIKPCAYNYCKNNRKVALHRLKSKTILITIICKTWMNLQHRAIPELSLYNPCNDLLSISNHF